MEEVFNQLTQLKVERKEYKIKEQYVVINNDNNFYNVNQQLAEAECPYNLGDGKVQNSSSMRINLPFVIRNCLEMFSQGGVNNHFGITRPVLRFALTVPGPSCLGKTRTLVTSLTESILINHCKCPTANIIISPFSVILSRKSDKNFI